MRGREGRGWAGGRVPSAAREGLGGKTGVAGAPGARGPERQALHARGWVWNGTFRVETGARLAPRSLLASG